MAPRIYKHIPILLQQKLAVSAHIIHRRGFVYKNRELHASLVIDEIYRNPANGTGMHAVVGLLHNADAKTSVFTDACI